MKKYTHGHNTDSGLLVLYKNQQLEVKSVSWTSYRKSTEYNSQDEVIVLQGGVRLTTAHFKYGLVKIVGNYFNWRLKLIYCSETLRDLIYNTNPLLSRIPKDSNFSGAYLPVPLVYK